jgi:hypothetical protein
MCRRNGEQIPTSFDIFSEPADLINPTEVYVDRFRGFEFARGQLKSCCSRLRLSCLNSLTIFHSASLSGSDAIILEQWHYKAASYQSSEQIFHEGYILGPPLKGEGKGGVRRNRGAGRGGREGQRIKGDREGKEGYGEEGNRRGE